MNKWKKRGIIAAVIVVIAAAAGLSLFNSVAAETVTVKKTTVKSAAIEKGQVVSARTGNIFSEVQGRVQKVYVEEGDTVAAGELLAEIDDAETVAAITRLEGELKAAEGSGTAAESQGGAEQVRQRQLALDQAVLAFNQAKSTYLRTQNLYNQGAAPLADLEQDRTDMDTANKAMDQAKAALTAAQKQSRGSSLQTQGQKESIKAQLDNLKKQKAKARITAGKAGMVFAKKIKEGDYVSPGTMLFTVGNAGQVKVETYVNSKDRAGLRMGDEATVAFKTPGKDVQAVGVIQKIAPAAEERVSALGILEDKIKVTVELRKYPEGLPVTPGSTVDVTLTTQQIRNVLAIPKEAVFADEGKDYVWAVRKGSAVLVQVETGVLGDELTEIKKGLSEGEAVILNPHQQDLQEGVKIK